MMKRLKLIVAACVLFGATWSPAGAATKYWDLNGTTAGSGANGTTNTWDTGTTANWDATSDGSGAATTWANNDSARFAAGTDATAAYTVTVSGTQQVTQIGLEEGGTVTFNGGIIKFTHAAAATSILTGVVTGVPTSAIINSQISSNANVGFKVARNLGLTNVITISNPLNDWTGTTTINGDNTLKLAAADCIPDASPITIAAASAGGILDLNGFNETIATVSGSNTAIKITLGAGNLTVANPAGESFAGVISGTGAVTKNGGGSWILSNANTYSGGTTIGAGVLEIGSNATTNGSLTSSGLVTNNGTLRYNRTDTGNVTQSGIVSGTGMIVKDGPGVLTLSGANTFNGGLSLNAGTIRAGNNAGLGLANSSVGIANGTILATNSATNRTLTYAFFVNGNFTLGDATGTGIVTMAGTIDLGGAPRTITVAAAQGTISGVIASGGIIKDGAGILAINGNANVYAGNTTINAGTLQVDSDGKLGDGTGTLNLAGGAFNISASRTTSTDPIPNPINMTADTTITTTSTAANATLSFTTSNITATAGTLTLRNDGADATTDVFDPRFTGSGFNFSRPIVLATGSTATPGSTRLSTFNPVGTSNTFSGVISGTGSFRRSATSPDTGGDTILSAQNTYSGGTENNGGFIGFGSSTMTTGATIDSGPIGTGPITIGASTSGFFASGGARVVANPITMNSGTQVKGSDQLELSGTIDLGTANRMFTVTNTADTILSGVISGAGGGLTKAGSGTLKATGANTYTGDTLVSGGTLSITNAYLADAADIYLTTGSIFDLNFVGADTIDSLFIDTVSQATGTWGAVGSGAAHESALITGTGLLQVTTLVPPAGVPGDYNGNGVVDAADYIVWRKNNGTNFQLQNEVTGTTPGQVTDEDYDAWRARFGNVSGAGSSLGGTTAAVPEPSAIALVTLTLISSGLRRRSSRR